MKTFSSLPLIFALAVALPLSSRAHDGESHATPAQSATALTGTLVPVADAKPDATWLAQARAAYPLDHCVVSNDKFDGGEMGQPQDFVYRADHQPDRLVRLCCKDCIKDFKKDPASYLHTLDAATAAKAKSAK